MHNITSFSVIAKVGLLIGVMLALFLLSSGLYDYAHARTAPETIDYEEGRTDAVAAFTAVDPEGHGIQWALSGNDAPDFSIDGGALTFKSTPDYENPVDAAPYNVYEVTVEATDGSLALTTEDLIVKVIDVDEDGIVTLSALQPQEVIPLTATLTDADGGPGDGLPLQASDTDLTDETNSTEWRWSRSASKTGTFTDIVGTRATSRKYTPVADDVGMYLRATATYDDREGEGKTAHMVSANPVRATPYENAAPVFKNEYDEVITGGIDRSVAEDAASGDAVGDPVSATDDARDVLTYTLTDSTNTFTIDSGTGQIEVALGETLDFDTAPTSYPVTVKATDPPGLSDEIMVTIAVIDVDEAPTIVGGATAKDYAESTADVANTMPVDTYTATDPEDGNNTSVGWSLSGADSSKFSIATNGVLTFNDPPDFEAEADANSNNIYEVTVTATDSTGNTASRDVTVNVTNVNETGTVTLSTVQPQQGHPLMAVLTDPDGSISGVVWLWDGDGANTNSSTYTPVEADFAANSGLTVRVTYTDGEGGNKNATATSVHAVQQHDSSNVAPKFPDQDQERTGDQSSSTPRSVPEHAEPNDDGTIGDPVKAIDCDDVDPCDPNTDNLTYSLEGRDAASFSINWENGQLSRKATLDYETKKSYTVTVKATDPSGLSDMISVTITVIDVNEMPELSGVEYVAYAENATSTVATYTARDPEKRTITWTLAGADADDFTITNGTLRFSSPPNFESAADNGANNTYEVTVQASDGGQATTAEKEIRVEVLNLDEPGTVTLSTEQPKDAVEITATLTDPDGIVNNNDVSWQWAQSSSRTRSFTNIRDATDSTFRPGDDPATDDVVEEPSYAGKYLRATVTYKDPQSTRVTKTAFFVATRPVLKKDYVNQKPVFPDQNPDTTDIEDTETTRTIPETAAPRTVVGATVSATDMGETRLEVLTYTLTDTNTDSGHADLFDIDRRTGQIRVKQGTVLNFSGDTPIPSGNNAASYAVTVTATDPGGMSASIEVTISVTNVDEAPTIDAPNLVPNLPTGVTAIDYAEERETTVFVSTYSATDPEDTNATDLKWSLSGNDADLFCIGNNDGDPNILLGQLRFKDKPDFEAPMDAGHNNTYNVTVVVTDSRGNTASRDVVVTVTNEDELGSITLSTEQPEDGVRLSAVLSDPDGRASSVRWKWWRVKDGETDPDKTDDDHWDEIARATSATYQPVAADQGKYLRVTVTYKDRESTTEDKMARVMSANEVQGPDTNNKPPKFPDQDPNTAGDQKDQTKEVSEDAVYDSDEDPNTGNVGIPVTAEDCDGAATCDANNSDNLTYSLGGTDSASFTIVRGTGQIQVAPGVRLDYETKQTYTVTVTATDPSFTGTNPSNARDTITVTITVTDENEPPTLSKRALVISGQSNVDHPENDRTTVATYTGAGPQATRVSWSLLGDDAGDFSISGGRLTFRGTPNYESPADRNTDNSYHVTIRAAGGGFTATRAVTVRVVNVDEDGAVTLSSTRAAVGVELTATLTDPDGRAGDTPPITGTGTDLTDDAAWIWEKSPDGSTGWASIAGANSNTYTPDTDDVGSYLRATANYTDGEGFGKSEQDETGRVTAVRPDGRVTLSSSRPEVGLDLTASVTDPDGGVSGLTWQWARSADGTTGWGDIFGATSGTYRPVPADLGDYLRATATYDDAEASGQSAERVSGVVIAVQPDGTVTLSSTQPAVGTAVTATLNDPDGSVSGLTWQWARSPNGSTGWTNISGATSEAYLPLAADDGMYLRATARYTDAQASGQTAERVSGSVGVEVDIVDEYDANNNGQIDSDEILQAVQDYFNDDLTVPDILTLIQAYFAN